MKHSCQNCKYHNINEKIKDERGKHECYGHSLICTPFRIGYDIDKENDCKKFEISGNETLEEIKKQWWMRGSFFERDESVELLVNLMTQREMQKQENEK